MREETISDCPNQPLSQKESGEIVMSRRRIDADWCGRLSRACWASKARLLLRPVYVDAIKLSSLRLTIREMPPRLRTGLDAWLIVPLF